MVRLLAGMLLSAGLAFAGAAADLARRISEVSLDPAECYRVRDLTISKEDVRFYLTDGYLIFTKPIDDARVAALFITDVAGGDAEVLLMPPTRSERRSLAGYTGSPNMDEHFEAAVLTFSDDSYGALIGQIRANASNRKSAEVGALLADQWSAMVRNIAMSYQTRLVHDLLSRSPGAGFFTAALRGKKLGNFDVTYDPQTPEQIVVGQVAYHDTRAFLDIWTSFAARGFRTGKLPHPEPEFALQDYRIDAVIDTDLSLSATTHVKLRPRRASRIFPFEIARQMKIAEVLVDGERAEVLESESLRSNLLRNNGNDLFLVLMPRALEAGRDYEVEFRHQGSVIRDAGNHVYFVGARSTWYPGYRSQYTTYDLNFRYPRELDLVTPGEVTEDKTDGAWRVTRRKVATPIRFAGFNLGAYECSKSVRAGNTVAVCANRTLERALQPKPPDALITPPVWGPRRRPPQASEPVLTAETAAPSPTKLVADMASEVASALEFMAARFGPPPLHSLTVSPIPGTFGQGFPGLIYLSTLSYLGPHEKPIRAMNARQQIFFSEILRAHEIGHQWWGNLVVTDAYHDLWLMEALANYSALLYVEKRKGPRMLETVLADYKDSLLKKTDSGDIVDAAGPIVLGPRLESSLTPEAWKAITYGKGSWIMHMLRRRMGDERFFKMLGEVRRRYERKPITSDEFRKLAAEFLPPKSGDPNLEGFFDQWVYDTGIPALKLSYNIKGKAPALRLVGTLTQSEVNEDFSMGVPIEIQFGRGVKPITHWVNSAAEPVTFTVALKQAPVKVVLDPAGSVLRR